MRQYVGARYVPTFADPLTWDNSHSYEALMMVDYMGDTYTSKKPVPPGIAITNTEYWVMTGSFNSQLNLIRSDVDDLDNIVNKRIVFVGDSYGEGTGNPYDKAITDSKIKYGINISSGSHGFIGDKVNFPYDDVSFQKLLIDNFSSIENPDTITDVYVLGGINDAYLVNEAGLVTAVEAFVSYCNANLPNAHVTVFLSSWTTNATYLSSLEKVAASYAKGAANAGASYVQGISAYFHHKSMMNDTVHPNTTGKNRLSGAVVDFIKNGKLTYFETLKTFTESLVTEGTIDTTDSEYRHASITMDCDYITIAGVLVVDKSNYSRADWISLAYQAILDVTDNDILVANLSTDNEPSMAFTKIIASNNNTQVCPGRTVTQNGKIYLSSGADSIDSQMDAKKVYLSYNMRLRTAFN